MNKRNTKIIIAMLLGIFLIMISFIAYLDEKNKILGFVIEENKDTVISSQQACDLSIKDEDRQKIEKTNYEMQKNKYINAVMKYSKERNIDSNLVLAVISHESEGNPIAKSVVGARGLMQIMPNIHFEECKKKCNMMSENDFYDSEKNICCGTKILKDYYEQSKSKEKSYSCRNTNKIYTGWEAALRRYNGWACGTYADDDYVETVLDYYRIWSGKCFSEVAEEPITTIYVSEHSVKPSFKVIVDYNINDYKTIKEDAENLIYSVESCEATQTALTKCIEDELKKDSYKNWQIKESSGRTFAFSINTNRKIPYYNPATKQFEDKNVEIKFALKFPVKEKTTA